LWTDLHTPANPDERQKQIVYFNIYNAILYCHNIMLEGTGTSGMAGNIQGSVYNGGTLLILETIEAMHNLDNELAKHFLLTIYKLGKMGRHLLYCSLAYNTQRGGRFTVLRTLIKEKRIELSEDPRPYLDYLAHDSFDPLYGMKNMIVAGIPVQIIGNPVVYEEFQKPIHNYLFELNNICGWGWTFVNFALEPINEFIPVRYDFSNGVEVHSGGRKQRSRKTRNRKHRKYRKHRTRKHH
jgi:hypothetical protein